MPRQELAEEAGELLGVEQLVLQRGQRGKVHGGSPVGEKLGCSAWRRSAATQRSDPGYQMHRCISSGVGGFHRWSGFVSHGGVRHGTERAPKWFRANGL